MIPALALLLLAQPAGDPFAKWEPEIVKIEKRLKEKPPAEGGIVFAGSSSIRLWDLDKSFPKLGAVNAGFGGSQMVDSTYFAERIILPLKPKTIVVYAGDNDLSAGKSPKQVRDDFEEFTVTIHRQLPKTKVYFIAVKPSVARWKIYDKQKEANGLVREYCSKNSLLRYVDIVPLTLGANGEPDPKYYLKDGLHLNESGYALWAELIAIMLAE